MDWDEAYSNAAFIPDGASYPALWVRKAQAFRASGLAASAHYDIAYGSHERQSFDLFKPEGRCKGLCVFVHGGYWMRFGKADWSHLAAGALDKGWAVALPEYRLCPDVSITDLVNDVAQGIAKAAAMIDGPVRLAGHSAGGHVVMRLVSLDSPLDGGIAARMQSVVSISGLHDLHPLMKTKMNDTLKITAAEADGQSPALLAPQTDAKLTCWVGAAERPEFLRQNALLVSAWKGQADITAHVEDHRHHFDVIEDLEKSGSALCRIFAP